MSERGSEGIEGPSGGRGKWGEAGVPHRGWTCVEIEDLEEPSLTCEMCEAREIRYVHHMQHPNYPDVLRSGCICAGHMEGDLVGAKDREKRMRNASRRRLNWVNRRGWKVSQKGNPTITADGYRVTIFPNGPGWRAAVIVVRNDRKLFSRRTYPTVNAAKLSAFDVMRLIEE